MHAQNTPSLSRRARLMWRRFQCLLASARRVAVTPPIQIQPSGDGRLPPAFPLSRSRWGEPRPSPSADGLQQCFLSVFHDDMMVHTLGHSFATHSWRIGLTSTTSTNCWGTAPALSPSKGCADDAIVHAREQPGHRARSQPGGRYDAERRKRRLRVGQGWTTVLADWASLPCYPQYFADSRVGR
jgi:hypothetical protein